MDKSRRGLLVRSRQNGAIRGEYFYEMRRSLKGYIKVTIILYVVEEECSGTSIMMWILLFG